MVFKPLGGKKASIEYQLKNKTAKVVFGNPKLTQRLIESSHFSQTYCGMVLSFEEDISPEQEAEILDGLTNVIRGGLEDDALDILVVRHADKRHPGTGKVRPDYHITAVETELHTGKHVTIYEHIKDHALFYAWERMVNIKHGFSRPDDPARRRSINIPKKLGKDRKKQLALIDKFILAEAKAGNIDNRADVIRFLERAGMSVPRQGKDYITIEDKEGNRTRLKGLFYERGFTIKGIGTGPAGAPADPDTGKPETLGEVQKRFSKLLAGRVAKFQKLYRRHRTKVENSDSSGAGGDSGSSPVQRGPDIGGNVVGAADIHHAAASSTADVAKPRSIHDLARTETDSARKPGHKQRPNIHRTPENELKHEKQPDGIDADTLGQIGRAGARSRTATETTTTAICSTATAVGTKIDELDRASSGLAATLAGFVRIATAFDRAIRRCRNPLGFLAQFLMDEVHARTVRQQKPQRLKPKFKPPGIS
ncbi:MAG: hypothetical protein U1F83_10340 [Verrucomicrobiota bacterium]